MSNVAPDSGDETLWHAARNNPDAFGVLYERHASAIYNHCFRRTASWSLAEDLTSAVFLDAWRKRRDVVLTGESVLPWLLAVANNALRNQNRTLRRQQRLLAKLPYERDETRFDDDAADRVDAERQMRAVLTAFELLSDAEKDVVSMCVWSGVEYQAAADVLKIPIGTVRSRVARARQKLQGACSDHPPPVSARSSP